MGHTRAVSSSPLCACRRRCPGLAAIPVLLALGCTPGASPPGSSTVTPSSSPDAAEPEPRRAPRTPAPPKAIELDGDEAWALSSERVVVLKGRTAQRFAVPSMELESSVEIPDEVDGTPDHWSAAPSPDGSLLALGVWYQARDGRDASDLGILDLDDGTLRRLPLPAVTEYPSLASFLWSADGDSVVVEDKDRTIMRWSVGGWESPAWVEGSCSLRCSVSADGRRVTGFRSHDAEEPGIVVHQFPPAAGTVTTTPLPARGQLSHPRVSADGTLVLAQQWDEREEVMTTLVWDLGSGEQVLRHPFTRSGESFVAFGPGRTLLLEEDEALVLRDLEGQELERHLFSSEPTHTVPWPRDDVAVTDRFVMFVGKPSDRLTLFVWER